MYYYCDYEPWKHLSGRAPFRIIVPQSFSSDVMTSHRNMTENHMSWRSFDAVTAVSKYDAGTSHDQGHYVTGRHDVTMWNHRMSWRHTVTSYFVMKWINTIYFRLFNFENHVFQRIDIGLWPTTLIQTHLRFCQGPSHYQIFDPCVRQFSRDSND